MGLLKNLSLKHHFWSETCPLSYVESVSRTYKAHTDIIVTHFHMQYLTICAFSSLHFFLFLLLLFLPFLFLPPSFLPLSLPFLSSHFFLPASERRSHAPSHYWTLVGRFPKSVRRSLKGVSWSLKSVRTSPKSIGRSLKGI